MGALRLGASPYIGAAMVTEPSADALTRRCDRVRCSPHSRVSSSPPPSAPHSGEQPGREGLSPPSSRLPRAAAAAAAAAGPGPWRGGARAAGGGQDADARGTSCAGPRRPHPGLAAARTDAGRPDARSGGRASERGPPPGRAARPPPAARGLQAPVATSGPRPDPGCRRLSPNRCFPGPCLVRPEAQGARDSPVRPVLNPALDPGSASFSPPPPQPRRRGPAPTSALEFSSVPSFGPG